MAVHGPRELQQQQQKQQKHQEFLDGEAMLRYTVKHTFLHFSERTCLDMDDAHDYQGRPRAASTPPRLHGRRRGGGQEKTDVDPPWLPRSERSEEQSDESLGSEDQEGAYFRHSEATTSCGTLTPAMQGSPWPRASGDQGGGAPCQAPVEPSRQELEPARRTGRSGARPRPPECEGHAVQQGQGQPPREQQQASKWGRSQLADPHPWDGVVTVMIRQLPRQYTQLDFLQEVDARGFAGCYDFVYIPLDIKKNYNVGYGFISFLEPHLAQAFRKVFDGVHIGLDRAHKSSPANRQSKRGNRPLCVHPAATQGFEANYAHFKDTKTGQKQDPAFSPLFFHGKRYTCSIKECKGYQAR